VVKAATSFSRSGVTDWIVQRVSALVLGAYALCVMSYVMLNAPLTFQSWQEYILSTPMKLFTLLALLSLLGHAWVGLWTVATDYIKPLGLRLAFHVFYALALIVMLAWGIDSLWF